jgi:hypothetical protein
MFGARLWARMPPEYLAALKAFAFQSNVPVAEYVRGIVHDHILQRGAALRERGAALRALINAGKAWVIAYHDDRLWAFALAVFATKTTPYPQLKRSHTTWIDRK